MVDVRSRFGARVRELRTTNGWCQETLADRCGLHRTYIGGVERGEQNISLANIDRIAKALGASLSELFAPLK
jgi:transcriptional regulator with XRE-family HTH domain